MIEGFPEQVGALQLLNSFDLGDHDAVNDRLLKQCFVSIWPISNFLQDRHNILIGAKGSGKSAVFTLLKEGAIDFSATNNHRRIKVFLSDKNDYLRVQRIMNDVLQSNVRDVETRYQFLWEVFILYRICSEILAIGNSVPEDLQNLLKEYTGLFSSRNRKPKLLELFSMTEKSFGVRIDSANPLGVPNPDFYVKVSPPKGTEKERKQAEVIKIDLHNYRVKINSFLKDTNRSLCILIDNLDDFAAQQAFNAQIALIQGLFQCSQAYGSMSHISLKLFLRTDLYHKLDFSRLGGYDKISPSVVEMRWKKSDIRDFIAKRLAYNLIKTYKVENLRAYMNEKSLYISPEEEEKGVIYKICSVFRKCFRKRKVQPADSRITSASDSISKEIITTLFPETIEHITGDGKREEYSIFKYFETHFSLATGETTPRTILMYLNKLISRSRSYYVENIDEDKRRKDSDGRYHLFRKGEVIKAYFDLQHEMLEVFKSCIIDNQNWRNMLNAFFLKKGKKHVFGYDVILNIVKGDTHADISPFLDYLCHLGVLLCRDGTIKHTRRYYELPIMLRYIWDLEEK